MANIRDIVNYFKDYQTISFLSVTASSLFEIIDLVVPYSIGQILNLLSHQELDLPVRSLIDLIAYLMGHPSDVGLSYGVLLGIIFMVTVVRSPIQPWIGGWFHWYIPLKARRDQTHKTLEKILGLPLEFYDENNPGRIAGRLARGLSNHTWTYPEIAGQLIPKLARVLAIFIMIWLVNYLIAVLFLVSFMAILSFSISGLKYLIRKEEILDEHIEETESYTSEIITNIKTVKAFANEEKELKRQMERLEREFKVTIYRIHLGYVKLATKQKTIIQTSVFVVLLLTLIATLQGHISLGHFVTTLTVSSMAYSELEPIGILAETFARRYASMLRYHEFMEQPMGEDAALKSAANVSYKFTGKVEFCNLNFGYNSDRLVLQDINLLIHPYQTVALVGRSGSGKSTLIKLLLRYFQPTSGQILIDGEDINKLNITGYRKRLAIVHQEVDIFNGTLLENLCYGNPWASLADVEQACRMAKVDEVIKQLPAGYGTIVGERGVRLSGGQRQRLGIARALLVNPDVLIFDEATSSLDYESERAIQSAMKSLMGTRTTIIIAHRLSTIRDADVIVVLDQGTIREVGNHRELIAKGGLYSRLNEIQEMSI